MKSNRHHERFPTIGVNINFVCDLMRGLLILFYKQSLYSLSDKYFGRSLFEVSVFLRKTETSNALAWFCQTKVGRLLFLKSYIRIRLWASGEISLTLIYFEVKLNGITNFEAQYNLILYYK